MIYLLQGVNIEHFAEFLRFRGAGCVHQVGGSFLLGTSAGQIVCGNMRYRGNFLPTTPPTTEKIVQK